MRGWRSRCACAYAAYTLLVAGSTTKAGAACLPWSVAHQLYPANANDGRSVNTVFGATHPECVGIPAQQLRRSPIPVAIDRRPKRWDQRSTGNLWLAQVGEIDRARAIYVHAASLSDPRIDEAFWGEWKDFEVQFGNEDTYREMLRIRRSVAASFSQLHFNTAIIDTATGAPSTGAVTSSYCGSHCEGRAAAEITPGTTVRAMAWRKITGRARRAIGVAMSGVRWHVCTFNCSCDQTEHDCAEGGMLLRRSVAHGPVHQSDHGAATRRNDICHGNDVCYRNEQREPADAGVRLRR